MPHIKPLLMLLMLLIVELTWLVNQIGNLIALFGTRHQAIIVFE